YRTWGETPLADPELTQIVSAKKSYIEKTQERIRDIFPENSRPLKPWGEAIKKRVKEDRATKTMFNLFENWINQESVPTNKQQQDRFNIVKNRLEDWIIKYHPNVFEGEITTSDRFTDQWFYDNKNVKAFQFQSQRKQPKGPLVTFLPIAEKLAISKKASADVQMRKKQKIIAGKNIRDLFKTALNMSYNEIKDELKPTLTKEIWDKYQRLKKNNKNVLTEKQTEDFIKKNLDVQVTETKRTEKFWRKAARHVTYLTKVLIDIEHIVDIGVSDYISEFGEVISDENIDSLGYDHPLAWIFFPSALNSLIRPGRIAKSSDIKRLAEKLGIEIKKPIDIPIVKEFLNTYFRFLEANIEEAKNNPSKWKILAAEKAANSIKGHSNLKDLNLNLEEGGKTIGKELTPEQIESLDLGGIDVELAKEGLYEYTEEQFQYVRDNRALFASAANEEGNFENDYHGRDPILKQALPTEATEETKEYKREAGWHQNAFTSFASFMWSKPVET
ncbi:MAG TPA: hypothetical protein DCL80_09930, partial [Balneola sp.]|nr:hypothetical protein [Balneola sp.]